MAHISADRVKETTTTTGTGAITLGGAVTGFQAFSAVCANGDTCWYCIAGGAEWEIGLGTWATGGTLTRTTVLKSSNANAAVNFSSGTKDVFITLPADKVVDVDADGAFNLVAGSTDPATPAASNIKFYAKNIGGRIMPKWIGPSGVDTPFQAFLGMNSVCSITTGTGTTVTTVCTSYGVGFVAGGTGTITYALTTPATGSLKSRTRLSTLSPAGVSGNLSYVKAATLMCARETGFFMVMRFGLDTMVAGQRTFFGLWGSATALTNIDTIASIVAHVGLACNVNTGNWFLCRADGSTAGSTDLGGSFPLNITDLMELVLFCAPGASTISYRVTNMSTGATTSGDLTTLLPGATTYLCPQMFMTNNTTLTATKWSFKSCYVETDF